MPHRALTSSLATIVATGLIGLAACSRADDKPAAAGEVAARSPEAAPAAGGPRTLKPGLWTTVTQTPAGEQTATQCVGEGYDPGAEAGDKASPCGKPTVTRTADGFHLDQACKHKGVDYALSGVVSGDFTTTATTDLGLTLSAYGRKQTLKMRAVSTYQGACDPATWKPEALPGAD
ncbi:hypothetical protein BH10PSE4_BH10PSE4_47270 [soil metagenome]